MVLICISLTISDVWHLFMYLLAFSMHSLVLSVLFTSVCSGLEWNLVYKIYSINSCGKNKDHVIAFFFFFNYLFIYLCLAVLGLRFCARAFSVCSERGPLFIAARGPLTIAASLAAEHGLQTRRLSSCGSRAQLLRGTWDLPRPGLEPVSPALAGRFSTTAPPGKPHVIAF